jgi:hypothetical protein
MSAHRHSARTTKTRCFSGPVVVRNQNRAAHGNVVYVDVCACGAERRRNVNGCHYEQGPWVDAEEVQS